RARVAHGIRICVDRHHAGIPRLQRRDVARSAGRTVPHGVLRVRAAGLSFIPRAAPRLPLPGAADAPRLSAAWAGADQDQCECLGPPAVDAGPRLHRKIRSAGSGVSPTEGSRMLPWLAYAAAALFYLCAPWLDPTQSNFSVDSWSYQELAHSFGGDTPYEPVLLRSFWSLEHSAAFPPGYPWLLHLLQTVFGTAPYVAVWFCVCIALLTPLIAARLARTLGVATEAGLLAGVALLGFARYFEEVLSARAIPLAVAAVLGGLVLLLEARTAWRAVAGGALLGFACLVRFDQLPLMLLILGYAWWRGTRPRE